MSSGNDAPRPGEQPTNGRADGGVSVDGPTDSPADGPTDDAGTTTDAAAPADPERPGERRRKAGVRYRPV